MSAESQVSVARKLAEFCGEMAEHYSGLLAGLCHCPEPVHEGALGAHYFKLRHQWLARRQRFLIQIALPAVEGIQV